MKRRAILLFFTLTTSPALAQAASPRVPSILEQLQDPALDPVRYAERVETFAMESVIGRSPELVPGATLVETDLGGRFVALPERTPVSAELGQKLSNLVLDRRTYGNWIACLFSPGVGIRFHRGDKAVDAFVCFNCGDLDLQVVGSTRGLFRTSFWPADARLLALLQEARPTDTRLDDVRKAREKEEAEVAFFMDAENRWRQATPGTAAAPACGGMAIASMKECRRRSYCAIARRSSSTRCAAATSRRARPRVRCGCSRARRCASATQERLRCSRRRCGSGCCAMPGRATTRARGRARRRRSRRDFRRPQGTLEPTRSGTSPLKCSLKVPPKGKPVPRADRIDKVGTAPGPGPNLALLASE